MDLLEQIFTTTPVLVVLTLVVVLEWLLPVPFNYSPARGFRLLADSFVKKVATKGDSKQQYLAGWLSICTYLMLWVIIFAALLFAIPNDMWTEGVLLYFALGYQAHANVAKNVQDGVEHGQKQMARDLLSSISLYQTNRLSELGINKLTLESVIGQFVSAWLMPILLFLLFGGFAAIVYRMLLEAYYAWHPDKVKLTYFGRPIAQLKNTLEWIPFLFLAPVYSVLKSSPGWLTVANRAKPEWKTTQPGNLILYWLAIVSCGCKAELAGPVMTENRKIRRPRLNKGAPLTDRNIGQLLNWNNRFRIILVMFNITVIGLLFGLSL